MENLKSTEQSNGVIFIFMYFFVLMFMNGAHCFSFVMRPPVLVRTNVPPITPDDLQRRRAVSPLKIKIPVKISAGSVARRDLIPALKG
jgi:hypothetical protein